MFNLVTSGPKETPIKLTTETGLSDIDECLKAARHFKANLQDKIGKHKWQTDITTSIESNIYVRHPWLWLKVSMEMCNIKI